MAVNLFIPQKFSDDGWRLKIRDNEYVEEPHVTLIGKETWRISLRTGDCLDRIPPPAGIPRELAYIIKKNLSTYARFWNAEYPDNPA